MSLVIQLPRQESPPPQSRHADDQYHNPPASSSFGSDLQSSWTFLEALPPSLSTPGSSQQPIIDGNVDFVVRRWDAAVRHLSIVEKMAKDKIFALLLSSQVDDSSSSRKAPKEKRMQRINQKIIRLPAFSLVDDQELCRKSFQAINFVRNAFSTPSVRPLPGGHWLEEARIVARSCNQNGKDRFLVVLLSAFLGNHFEWINEIGREMHERRLLLKWKRQEDKSTMRSRTIIICEDRILARRLVFLLASFLFPGMLSLRSISSPDVHRSSTRSQHEKKFSGKIHLVNAEVSTSISSAEEDARVNDIPGTSGRRLRRNPSETSSLRTAHLSVTHQDSNFHKSSAGTTTTVTPSPSTPLAYVTSMPQTSDSYFPTAPSAARSGSAAAASLQRLRRSSSTASSAPSTWGSLLGSIWSNKQLSSTATSNTTVPSDALASTSTSSRMSHCQASFNQLESMAQEVGTADSPVQKRPGDLLLSSEQPAQDIPPRLEVDEKDGVVDVDLKLPSSLLQSYASSPDMLPAFPTPMSTSTASLDDARSFFSVRSSPKTSADHVSNIAGYLKHYHPDFVLQAVRSCSEKDVRESMTYADTAAASPGSSYEECNTLIADARNYSVKRLTLRRKARTSENEADKEQRNALHDDFSLESIISYDETLADAIDRALDRPSVVPSRLPSPSPSQSRHFRTVSTGTASTANVPSLLAPSSTPASTKDTLQPVPVPQANRGQFIIDALKEVVGEVDRDLHSSERSEKIPTGVNINPSISKPRKTEENVLREGVKRWLQGAEETSVW